MFSQFNRKAIESEVLQSKSAVDSLEHLIHTRSFHRLASESHSIFLNLQRFSAIGNQELLGTNFNTDTKQLYEEFSGQYRAVLRSYIDDVMQSNQEGLVAHGQLMQIGEMIWHAAEIMFLEDDSLVAPLLSTWVQVHYSPDFGTLTAFADSSEPELLPRYWESVQRLVLQGALDAAVDLLSLHSQCSPSAFDPETNAVPSLEDKQTHPVNVLMIALQSMPFPSASNTFAQERRNWLQSIQNIVDWREEFSADSPYLTVAKILLGDTAVIAASSQTWFEQLCARVLFTSPTSQAYDVPQLVVKCLEMKGTDPLTLLDHTLDAVFALDPLKTIRHLHDAGLGLCWVGAHLADLLVCAGLIDPTPTLGLLASYLPLSKDVDVRECLLLEYVSLLESVPALLFPTANYLAYCPALGRTKIQKFLLHQDLTTPEAVWKLVGLARHHGLEKEARLIARRYGMQYLHADRPEQALPWVAASHDATLLHRVGNIIVDNYFAQGSFSDLSSVLNALRLDSRLANMLVFLSKYHELSQLWEADDLEGVARELLVLFNERIAPKRYWIVLLRDAIRLLENSKVLFDHQATLCLLSCLEELMLDHNSKAYLETVGDDAPFIIEVVRLALVRNLARSITC